MAKNLGAATLIVTLADGIITATHENGTVLYRGTADKRSWDKIVAGVKRSCADGSGPLVTGGAA